MRILHKSDWHLGQHFMGKSREAEHRAFIQWLLDTINQHKVDALLIAGDVFDTGAPPSYARTLYNQLIVQLKQTYFRHLVIVGGNHDSVSTLNESREFLAILNTHVVGGVMDDIAKQVITLKDASGTVGTVICAVPFIRPRDVIESCSGDTDTDKQQELQNAIANHYQSVYKLAKEQQLPVIATGHLTTVGGQVTESVRDIYIGTLKAFPVSALPPADYIALGHLHRTKKVSDSDHIRYSGSPIPLSFDEISSEKQVVMVDVTAGKRPVVSEITVPLFRPLHSLKGTLDTLGQQISVLATMHQDSALTPWLEVIVSTDDYLSELQSRVEILVSEGAPKIDLLRTRRDSENSAIALQQEQKQPLDELDVPDVFRRRLRDEAIEPERIAALTHAFNEILETLHEEPEPDKNDVVV